MNSLFGMFRGHMNNLNMLDEDYMPKQHLLLYYSCFTCIYFPSILMFLKLSGNIYNVGTFKFLPILMILMFAEVTKLSFSSLQKEQPLLSKIDSKNVSKVKNPWSKRLKDIFRFMLFSMLTTFVYCATVVMFGCPVMTHHEETFMLAITLTCLTFIPATLQIGLDDSITLLSGAPMRTSNIIVDATRRNVKATLLGTWLGATVIPLDWNRPWQAWPIPCITGALIGYMLSHFLTLIKTLPLFKWKKR